MSELQIGGKLKTLRKALNLSMEEVAEKVNLSQSYISYIEKDRSVPNIVLLSKILKALETDLVTFAVYINEDQKQAEELILLTNKIKQLSPAERTQLNSFLVFLKSL
ncbi:Helix-turn-helix [Gracilibacillus orientalis]|uniref:Helix-turn-helix n=1 Tax=Gracilibacillus orientalis TaxID=334253 RepID=A0A1I4PFE7_9BACI|nr:helix-turn-helix transcriptional regulator [Gracilibacillus orientalis]SFM26407.1 Helix-turn-helix [Gracilibacillus orientalis]